MSSAYAIIGVSGSRGELQLGHPGGQALSETRTAQNAVRYRPALRHNKREKHVPSIDHLRERSLQPSVKHRA